MTARLTAGLPEGSLQAVLPSFAGQRGIVNRRDDEPAVEAEEFELPRITYQIAFGPDDPEMRREADHVICEPHVEYRVLPGERTVTMIRTLAMYSGEPLGG